MHVDTYVDRWRNHSPASTNTARSLFPHSSPTRLVCRPMPNFCRVQDLGRSCELRSKLVWPLWKLLVPSSPHDGLCMLEAPIAGQDASLMPCRHHIHVPESQARRFDDRSLRTLAFKAQNGLLSFQIDSCCRLSTFCILEVLLNNKQLAEVSHRQYALKCHH